MSDPPPPRKSTLKKPMTRRLRRGIGMRKLIDTNGRAMIPPPSNPSNEPRRTLMFANTAQVRPFNFRNTANQTVNASENSSAPLVNGKNARGNPPGFSPSDPRKNPEFAEYLGTDPAELKKSMERNRITQSLGINRPTINTVRPRQNPTQIQNIKTIRRMVAQHKMGYKDPLMNNLLDQYIRNYKNTNNLTDNNIITIFEQPYKNLMERNTQIALRAANRNAKTASSRKTRRNRK